MATNSRCAAGRATANDRGTGARGEDLSWVRFVTGLVGLAMVAIPVGRQTIEWSASTADAVVVAQASGPAPQAHGLAARVSRHSTLRAASRHAPRLAATEQRPRPNVRVARADRVLTRAQVLREYIAGRDQVAALTGEDSGSVWLTRVAARQ